MDPITHGICTLTRDHNMAVTIVLIINSYEWHKGRIKVLETELAGDMTL